MKLNRHLLLAMISLWVAHRVSFGATWYLQGTGNFESTNTWRLGSNAGTKGIPAATDDLKFWGGGAPDPLVGADVTLTLTSNQTVTLWDQRYHNGTVRLNLNGRNLTVSDGLNTPNYHLMEGDTGNRNYIYGGGTLTSRGLKSVGYASGGCFLSGSSTVLRFTSGDSGIALGGGYGPAAEVRLEVTGGSKVINSLAMSYSQVGMGTTGRGYATVHLSDPGSRMDFTGGGYFTIGVQGRGLMTVTNGGAFKCLQTMSLGGYLWETLAWNGTIGNGTLRVDGVGSTVEASAMNVGMYSTGAVHVVSGGALTNSGTTSLGVGFNSSSPGFGTNKAAYGYFVVSNLNSWAQLGVLTVGIEGKGEVTVADKATLAATGSITFKNSRLTVSDASCSSGATVATTGSSNTIRIELGARSHASPYIHATTLNLGAGTTLDLAILGSFSATVGEQIKLISHTSRTGTFVNYTNLQSFTNGAYRFQIVYGSSDTYLTVAEDLNFTPSHQLVYQKSGTNLTLSWNGNGYRLQCQTNALNQGLGTNWFDYPGGTASPVVVAMSPANPAMFFRLKYNITADDMFKNYVPAVYVFGALMRSNVTKTVAGNSLIISAVVSNASTLTYGQFGGFILPQMVMGTNAFGYDFSGSGVLVPLSTAHTNEQLWAQYPRDGYSPLLVLKQSNTLVCFSFHYPVLQYRHNSQFAVKYLGNGLWQPTHLTTFFDYPDTPPSAYHRVGAYFEPGLSRTYRMVITTGSTLEEVIAPYKAYFDSLYPGGKQYTPDLEPLMPIALASHGTQGYPTTNPYGWYPEFAGADTLGFSATVVPQVLKFIRGAPGDYNAGNSNFMIWTPTGIVDGDLSYPYQFTARWSAFTGGTAGTVAALQALTNSPGRRMGLWWGHAIDYQPNWNSRVGRTEFDWTNPTHRASGHAQMSDAIAAGASFIGLDAFAHGLGVNPGNTNQTDGCNQVWYILPWLQELKATYPQVKFITEGMASDVMHRETATYLDYWSSNGTKRLHGRHLLADILLPGSEIVAGIYYNVGETVEPWLWGGRPYWDASNFETCLDICRISINYGYVPIPFYRSISLDHDL